MTPTLSFIVFYFYLIFWVSSCFLGDMGAVGIIRAERLQCFWSMVMIFERLCLKGRRQTCCFFCEFFFKLNCISNILLFNKHFCYNDYAKHAKLILWLFLQRINTLTAVFWVAEKLFNESWMSNSRCCSVGRGDHSWAEKTPCKKQH